MKDYQSLCHTRWDGKFHVVFIPKRRKKVIYGKIRQYPGEIFHELARQKECKIVEGHLKADHVHMCLIVEHLQCSDIFSPAYPGGALRLLWLLDVAPFRAKKDWL